MTPSADLDLTLRAVAFGAMGTAYARRMLGQANPTVGLLNIGEEESKGSELALASYRLLRDSPLNFVGNVEGRDLLQNKADVVVTDGFTGNVLLKGCEGVVEWIGEAVKEEVMRGSLIEKFGAWLMRPALRRFKHRSDYAETGGAPLIGVDGVVIVCHGGSDARAIKNAILTAGEYATIDLRSEIRRSVVAHSFLWSDVVAPASEEA